MEESSACDRAAMRAFETELMLLVNQRLYENGSLPAEVYIKAKEQILKL